MITYASALEVSRPPEEVFAAVIDITRWDQWTDMRGIRQDGSGSLAVGSTGTFTLPGPFSGPIRYELTALERNRRVEYRMAHPSFDWRAEVVVEPIELGASLATSGEFQLRGWRRLLEPIVGREIRRGEAAELVRLKGILEAPSSAAPAGAGA